MTPIQRLIAAAAFVVLTPLAARAQAPPAAESLSPLQIEVGCAIPPEMTMPGPTAIRVMGSQDTVARGDFAGHDLLVLDAGTTKGVRLGQRYFVRRPTRPDDNVGAAGILHTSGWLRVIAVDDSRAIAAVDQTCSSIRTGDFLEPFVVPSIPTGVSVVDRSVEPDFTTMGRVLFGDNMRETAGAGDFMLIDRGSNHGLTIGSRVAIYRDVRPWWKENDGSPAPQLPLTSVGEAMVVTTGDALSVIRVLSARDAVTRGDYVAPRKRSGPVSQ